MCFPVISALNRDKIAWRPCSCRCPTAISIRRKAASRGARCEIADIASCSRRRPAGRHVPIRNGDRRGAWTTRAMTVIRSRFSIPGVISPRPARTWSDRALLLRLRDTSISFSRNDGPHEACEPPRAHRRAYPLPGRVCARGFGNTLHKRSKMETPVHHCAARG
jgi:hypothetical protein